MPFIVQEKLYSVCVYICH